MRSSALAILKLNDPVWDTGGTAMGRLLMPTFTLFACGLVLVLCIVLHELAGFMTA